MPARSTLRRVLRAESRAACQRGQRPVPFECQSPEWRASANDPQIETAFHVLAERLQCQNRQMIIHGPDLSAYGFQQARLRVPSLHATWRWTFMSARYSCPNGTYKGGLRLASKDVVLHASDDGNHFGILRLGTGAQYHPNVFPTASLWRQSRVAGALSRIATSQLFKIVRPRIVQSHGMKSSAETRAVVPVKPLAVIPTTVRIRELIRRVLPTKSGSLPPLFQKLSCS
jgi:hypothetical protein